MGPGGSSKQGQEDGLHRTCRLLTVTPGSRHTGERSVTSSVTLLGSPGQLGPADKARCRIYSWIRDKYGIWPQCPMGSSSGQLVLPQQDGSGAPG